MKNLAAAGGLINAALFLAGCFVAGLVLGVPLAWKGALLTAAVAYWAYFFGYADMQRVAAGLSLMSVAMSAAIGFVLLLA